MNVLNTQIIPHLWKKVPNLEEECFLLFSSPPVAPEGRLKFQQNAVTQPNLSSLQTISVIYLNKSDTNMLSITSNGILKINVSQEIGEILLVAILFIKSIGKTYVIISVEDNSISVVCILKNHIKRGKFFNQQLSQFRKSYIYTNFSVYSHLEIFKQLLRGTNTL